MALQPILIAGQWRQADSVDSFTAINPATGEALDETYPVSAWSDCDAALTAAVDAAAIMRTLPAETLAVFLETYADRIEAAADELVRVAHLETGLPVSPRLRDGELPRTAQQLRLAAATARDGSWARPTIDTTVNIRSILAPIGPVAIFGPNNFPFAYGSTSGGDFASAVAAGNPVIAKAHPSHPHTARLFAIEALAAARATGMPDSTVQMIFATSNEDGLRLVSDPRIGASGFTGSRGGGLALKEAADRAGKPIYVEMSSINPVIILPVAMSKHRDDLVGEFVASALMGAGQFCTNPNITLLFAGDDSEQFITAVKDKYEASAPGTLLSPGVQQGLSKNIQTLRDAGAQVLTEPGPIGETSGEAPHAHAEPGEGARCCYPNTLLRIDGAAFLHNAEALQTEAFGNASLMVVVDSVDQAADILRQFEGNLTGSIYSDTQGEDEDAYNTLAPILRQRVGRLLNDKMPTGVAVSPAMNHGGPYPSTGHPGFTAVGFPASMLRFCMLQCYDNVRSARLPLALQDQNPTGTMLRHIDNQWTTADVGAVAAV